MKPAKHPKSSKFSHRINYYSRTNMKLADDVFAMFLTEDGTLAQISRDFGIPPKTVSNWHKQFIKDPEWRPYLGKNHGLHHRIFTDEEEANIKSYINDNYINQGKLFTDADFRILLTDAFLEKHSLDEVLPFFMMSAHFIFDFKERNHISSRTAHAKRRSDIDEDRNIEWENNICELLNDFPRDKILNCDETSWRVYPKSIKTWAEKGAQNIQFHINGDEKESITVLATITSIGTKCPLFVIAKGKTKQCEESQLGDTAYHYKTHSENGWSTNETFQEYLHFISNYFNHEPLHLLLDLHTSHRGPSIYKLAAELNITLHYIPAGQTDRYQPLDRKIFGPLKSSAARLVRQKLSELDDIKISKKDAVLNLIKCWEHLSPDTVSDSWDCYEKIK